MQMNHERSDLNKVTTQTHNTTHNTKQEKKKRTTGIYILKPNQIKPTTKNTHTERKQKEDKPLIKEKENRLIRRLPNPRIPPPPRTRTSSSPSQMLPIIPISNPIPNPNNPILMRRGRQVPIQQLPKIIPLSRVQRPLQRGGDAVRVVVRRGDGEGGIIRVVHRCQGGV